LRRGGFERGGMGWRRGLESPHTKKRAECGPLQFDSTYNTPDTGLHDRITEYEENDIRFKINITIFGAFSSQPQTNTVLPIQQIAKG
jgi:hypothetical protein